MGSGKTTVGRQLASKLNRRFVDSDHEIEAATGVRIPVIFEIEGEAGFRRREVEMINTLTANPDIVLATGGGVVENSANRARLRERGFVVYLDVSPEVLYQRVRHDKNRPLLQVPDPLETLKALYSRRDPLYREVANLVLDGGIGAKAVVKRIQEELVWNG